MAKYTKEIVKQITDLIEADSYTIAEICDIVGIHKSTYHYWEANKLDFFDSIKKAKSTYDENLVVQAKRSLMKKIKGYTEQETKTVFVFGEVKERTVTDKHFQPDTACIIFTLTNKVPDEYKHRQSTEAKVDITTKIDNLSEDQLNILIDKILEQKPM